MTPPNYLEQDFEEHIEESLVNSGYTSSDPTIYDKTLCLIPTQLIGFIEETQPKTIEKLELQFGSETESKLIVAPNKMMPAFKKLVPLILVEVKEYFSFITEKKIPNSRLIAA